MERHCPGFMKLGLANDENALVEVDIRQLEGEGFGNAQPSAIQKSQQREVRLGPEGPSRRKSGRFREEGAKLDVAVDMWSEARTLPWPPREWGGISKGTDETHDQEWTRASTNNI